MGRHTQMHLCGRVAPQVCFLDWAPQNPSSSWVAMMQLFSNVPTMPFRPLRLVPLRLVKVRLFSTSTYSSHVSRSHSSYTHHRHVFGGVSSFSHSHPFFPHVTIQFFLYTHHPHSFFFLLLNRDVNHTFATMEGDDPNPFQLKHKEDAARAWKLEEAKRVLEEHQGVLK